MQITSDIELSGAGCTTAITPNQLVQSSSENDRLNGLCRFQKTAALNVRSRLHYSSGGVGSIRQRRAAAGPDRVKTQQT
ncbi:hypothetical protein KZ855_37510, partial [Pseudomonas aeruginosa]|nr:hypothetical protein [Pseudomonas aeruginosa]